MVELVIRVVFSLAVVLGLLWFVARTSSRRFGGGGRSMVRVLARQALARNASLAVVEVGERLLVVGVSENGVSLLTEMDAEELATTAQPPVEPAKSLSGSVLSGQTWRQAWAAATSRGGGSD